MTFYQYFFLKSSVFFLTFLSGLKSCLLIDLIGFFSQFSNKIKRFFLANYKYPYFYLYLYIHQSSCLKKCNCNNLVTGPSLYIRKNKFYLLFFYSQILYTSILTMRSLVTTMIAFHYCQSHTNLDITFYMSIPAYFRNEILYIL